MPPDRPTAVLAFAAALALGLSAGASLTEAVVLVAWWRTLPAEEFLAWFRANEPRLVAFYGPLQILSLLLVAAAAAQAAWRHHPARPALALAALLALAVLLSFPLYFRDANSALVAGAVAPADVAAALARWNTLHWVRTAIGTAAFAAAVAGCRHTG